MENKHTCCICKRPIPLNTVYYFDDNGNDYCRKCFFETVVDEFIAEHEAFNEEEEEDE